MLRGPVATTQRLMGNDLKVKVNNKDNVKAATFTEQDMLNALMGKSSAKPTTAVSTSGSNASAINASKNNAVKNGALQPSSISYSTSSDSESNSDIVANNGVSSRKPPAVLSPSSSHHQQLQAMMSKRTRSYSSTSSQSQASSQGGFVMVTDFEDDDEAGDSVRSHQLDSGYPSDVTTRGAGGAKVKAVKSRTVARDLEGSPHSDDDKVKVRRDAPPAKPRRTTVKTQQSLVTTATAVLERHDSGIMEPLQHDKEQLQLPSKTERLMGMHSQSSSSTINVDGDDERENTTDNDVSCYDSDFDDVSFNIDFDQEQRKGVVVASHHNNNNNNKNNVELTTGRLVGPFDEAAVVGSKIAAKDKTDSISLSSYVNIDDDMNGGDDNSLLDDQLPPTAIEQLLTDLVARYGSFLGEGKSSKTSPVHEQNTKQLEKGATLDHSSTAKSVQNQVKDNKTTPQNELHTTTTSVNNKTNINDKEAKTVRAAAAVATTTRPSPPTSTKVLPKVVNNNNVTPSVMAVNKDNRMSTSEDIDLMLHAATPVTSRQKEFSAETSNSSNRNNNNNNNEQPLLNSHHNGVHPPPTTSVILQKFLSAADDDDDDILSAISEEPEMPDDIIIAVTSAGRNKHDESRRASTSTLGDVSSYDFDDENDVTVIQRDRPNDVGTANNDGINNDCAPVSPTTTREADLLLMQYFCLPVHEDSDGDEHTSSTIKSADTPDNSLPTLSERVRANALLARDSLNVHSSDIVDSESTVEQRHVTSESRSRTHSDGLENEEHTSVEVEIKQHVSSETVVDNVDKQPTASDASKQPTASDVSKQPTTASDVSKQPVNDFGSTVNSRPMSRYESESNLQNTSSVSTTNLERDVSSSVMSVYSGAGGYETTANIPVTGDIQLTLTYDQRKTSLRLLVHQCRHLAVADARKKRTDPYVKAYLLPDKTRSGKRKTKCKKNTLSPVYNETLSFTVEKNQLVQRTLYISVWHRQTLGHNEFLGETSIRLDTLDFGQQQQSASWYTLKDALGGPLSSLTYRGELYLTLTFVSTPGSAGDNRDTDAGELRVKLQQARDLLSLRSNGSADAFCTGRLLSNKTGGSKQKTPVIKHDTNPQWQCELVFKSLTISQLRERALELCVWDHELLSNDFLGGTRLGLGTGKSNGQEAGWNDARGAEVGVWQAMLDQPNTPSHTTLLLRPHMNPRLL